MSPPGQLLTHPHQRVPGASILTITGIATVSPPGLPKPGSEEHRQGKQAVQYTRLRYKRRK